MKIVQKVWGQELWITNTPLYCGKILSLKKGFQCSYHKHIFKDETFYLLSGKVIMFIDGGSVDMDVGSVEHIKPEMYHSFIGVEDSEILEISTQHFEDDSYRLTESGPI